MQIEKLRKKGVVTALVAVSMLVGAVGGTTVLNAVQADAQTTTPKSTTSNTTSNTTTPPVNTTNPTDRMDQGAQGGTFHSNEDPTHEAQESPEREAQENAGQRPTVK